MEDYDGWLSIPEDTKVNSTTMDCTAELFTRENVRIRLTDNTINSARTLLPRLPSKEVWIDLSRKKSNVLGLFFEHHTYTRLHLNHQYKHPKQDTVCDSLLQDMPRTYLKEFKGHLSGTGTELLQVSRDLRHLSLAVCDQNAQETLAAIQFVRVSMPHLTYLYLHVPVAAVNTQACTTRLPVILGGVYLLLSGVDEKLLKRATKITHLLQPTTHRLLPPVQDIVQYQGIRFPGCSINANVWRRFLNELATAGVRVGQDGIVVPDASPITMQEEEKLSNLAKTNMLGGFCRRPEEKLWLDC